MQQQIDIKPSSGLDQSIDENDHEDSEMVTQEDEPQETKEQELIRDKKETHPELLLEPKNEYDDGQDETVEDLTLEDEDLLEDLDHAGPSHGGEGSSQGN